MSLPLRDAVVTGTCSRTMLTETVGAIPAMRGSAGRNAARSGCGRGVHFRAGPVPIMPVRLELRLVRGGRCQGRAFGESRAGERREKRQGHDGRDASEPGMRPGSRPAPHRVRMQNALHDHVFDLRCGNPGRDCLRARGVPAGAFRNIPLEYRGPGAATPLLDHANVQRAQSRQGFPITVFRSPPAIVPPESGPRNALKPAHRAPTAPARRLPASFRSLSFPAGKRRIRHRWTSPACERR